MRRPPKLLVLALLSLSILAAIAFLWLSSTRSTYLPKRPTSMFQGARDTYQHSGAALAPETAAVHPAVLSYLSSVPPGAEVLDLGCGNGALLDSFRDHKWNMTGVDSSPSGIAQARRHYHGIEFIQADITSDLTYLGVSKYDAVISTEVIEHLLLPRLLTANSYKLLKPGGVFVLSTPYHGYCKDLALSLLHRWDREHNPLWDYGHTKFFSPDTVSYLLYEAGFDRVEWRGAGKFPPFWASMVVCATKR